MSTIKTDVNDFVRSTESRALLNTDEVALSSHRARRQKLIDDKTKIQDLETRLSSMENLLQQLLKNQLNS